MGKKKMPLQPHACLAERLVSVQIVAQSSERARREKLSTTAATVAASLEGGSQEDEDFQDEEYIVTGEDEADDAAYLNLEDVEARKLQATIPSYDMRRSLAFTLYGGCYQGMALHFIYNISFTKWFGTGRAIQKVVISQLIMAPLLTLPVAYMFKGLVFGKTLREAINDYWIGLTEKGLLFSFWKLWVPIQLLIFTVIPPHMRIPFSSFFSFCWTVLLSKISNS